MVAGYNVQYFPVDLEQGLLCGFPDGYMFAVAVPIPVGKLDDALQFQLSTISDDELEVPVHSHLAVSWSAVNYIQGSRRTPDLNELSLAWTTIHETGMPLSHMPVKETASDGTTAVTVRRFHYHLVVGFVMRHMMGVLTRLARRGLVGAATSQGWDEGYPDAPEYRAMLLQSGPEFQPIELSFVDELGTRRLMYQDFLPPGGLSVIKENLSISGEQAEKLIREVQAWSADYMQTFEQAMEDALREVRERP
jgi:hypothetical protein